MTSGVRTEREGSRSAAAPCVSPAPGAGGGAGGLVVTRAFTTRLPLAVLIVLGVKRWENRAAMPRPLAGVCALTVSRGSSAREYAAFLAWARVRLPPAVVRALPPWPAVAGWCGRLIAVCDYEAGYARGDAAWDEGYPVWWRLANVRSLRAPRPVRGGTGMWALAPLRLAPVDFVPDCSNPGDNMVE